MSDLIDMGGFICVDGKADENDKIYLQDSIYQSDVIKPFYDQMERLCRLYALDYNAVKSDMLDCNGLPFDHFCGQCDFKQFIANAQVRITICIDLLNVKYRIGYYNAKKFNRKVKYKKVTNAKTQSKRWNKLMIGDKDYEECGEPWDEWNTKIIPAREQKAIEQLKRKIYGNNPTVVNATGIPDKELFTALLKSMDKNKDGKVDVKEAL